MTQTSEERLSVEDQGTRVRTFLIADIRGYSTFTRERGHADAARLAALFVDVASDAIEAHGGRVVEIRGDEVLAVFDAAPPAVRAGVDLQLACAEQSAEDPTLAIPAGVGIAAGESVRRGEQYHGASLNLAARLCSVASAGEVLVTDAVAELLAGDAELELDPRGASEFKGFDAPVEVVAVAPGYPVVLPTPSAAPEPLPLPPELDSFTPIVGRDRELHWLKGTWRAIRRGRGRVMFVSGPPGIGKTRLAAELAAWISQRGSGSVVYAGPGGTATADALSGIRGTLAASGPTLLVLDAFDAAGEPPIRALAEALEAVEGRPTMVLCLVQDPNGDASLAGVLASANRDGTAHRILAPLGPDEVKEIARLYAGDDLASVPLESIIRASGGVPGRVHEVMSEWARTEATRRLSAAAAYLAAGRTMRSADLEFANNVIALKLGGLYAVEAPADQAPSTERCPYKGLASFREEDAAYFFGRERLVGELAARTVQVGLLGVVGDSGSGKSSVVSAGLLPSLRAGILPGSERWQHRSLRPGEHPMAELTRALGNAHDGPGDMTVADAVGSVSTDERLVLFVDQFEEIFTTCTDEDEREAFVDALTAAATGSADRFVAVIALRGDFYGQCARFPSFADLLAANHVPIGPMTAEESRRAIELPARRAGLRVESQLTDSLIEEVADEPGALPLLSTALVELWQGRTGGWLRMESYEASGGLRGAVARLAEGTYQELDEQERERARAIFLRLVGPGEGDAVTRRRASLDELDAETDPVAAAVLARLTRDRLLTVSESSVEVAHEALLREWPRLRDWIEEDVQGHQLRQHLVVAARQWQSSGREPSELYRGARLSATLDWTATHGRELNELERTFVAESREAGERETRRIKKTNRRLRGLLVGVAIFLVVAVVAGSLAFVKQGQARRAAAAEKHAATVALSQSLGAESISHPRLDTAMLLAAEGIRLDDSRQTEGDLLTTILRSPSAIAAFRVGTLGASPTTTAVSPDGRMLAVINSDGRLWFYDISTHRPIGGPVLNVGAFSTLTAQFTPDGSELAVVRGPGAQMIDVRTRAIVRRMKAPEKYGGIQGLTLSPDGRYAYAQATAYEEHWDTSTGRALPAVVISGDASVPALDSPAVAARSGELVSLTSANGGQIEARNAATLAVERSFHVPLVPDAFFYSIAVSPDGRTAAYTTNQGGDSSLRFVDLRTGAVQTGSGGDGGGSIAFSPDDKTAVSTTADGKILVWDVASATVEKTFSGHSGEITSISIDAQGRTLYSTGADGNAIAWDLSGSAGFGRPFTAGLGSWTIYGQHVYPYFSSSPDGRRIAVTEALQHDPAKPFSSGGAVNIVDLASGRPTLTFKVAGLAPGVASISYAEFSPDGTAVLVSPGPMSNGDLSLWRLHGGTASLARTFSGLTATLDTSAGYINAPWATFSHDGRWIVGVDATLDGSNHIIEWDAATGAQRAKPLDLRWKVGSPVTGNVAFSPDGSLIASAAQADRIALIDAATLKVVRTFGVDPLGIGYVAFSPSGDILASGDAAGVVRLWSVRTGKQIGAGVQTASAGIESLSFDPTGRELLSTAPDTINLWSVPDLQQIGTDLPGTPGAFGAAAFTGHGSNTSIVAVYGFGGAIEWPATVGSWVRRACSIAGRNFSRDEWRLYVGSDRPYERACPGP